MAKTTELELAIKIAGQVDPSLYKSISQAQTQVSGLAQGMQNAAKLAGVAVASAVVVAGTAFADVTKEAIKFESDMAGVVKVTEGLRDENGNLTETYYEIADAVQYLSTQIPVNTEQLTSMAAIGAQSGVPVDELVQYATDASKMAIAFEIDPTQAGEMMAKWRTAFSMGQEEVVQLADEINYLANRTASSEEQISDVVTRIGNLGEIGGVATETLAVLGAVLTSNGMESENAATAIKRMILEMTSGSSVTARQAAVLDRLGISATELAQTMQDDSVSAMQDFLGAMTALPKAEQLSALNDFFGGWAVQGVSSLANNLETMKYWMDQVADSDTYAGSMGKEYEGFAATTESAIEMMKNAFQVLKQDIGSYELDSVRMAVLGIRDAIVQVIDNLPTIMDKVDEVVGYLLDNGPKVAAVVAGIATAWLGMLNAPTIERGVTGVINLMAGGNAVPAAGAATSAATAETNKIGIAGAVANYAQASGRRSEVLQAIPAAVQTNGIGATVRGLAVNAIAGGNAQELLATAAANPGLLADMPSFASLLAQSKAGKAASAAGDYAKSIGGALTKNKPTALMNWAANTAPGRAIGSAVGMVRTQAAMSGQSIPATVAGIVGNSLASTAPGRAVTGAYGAAKGAAGGVASRIATSAPVQAIANSGIGRAVTTIGTTAKAAGVSKLAVLGGMASNAVAASPVLGTVAAGIGNLAGGLGAFMGPIASGFGSILTTALPIVGVIGSIIAVVSILGDNLNGIRNVVQSVFGDQGVAVFDGFLAGLQGVKDSIAQAFSPESLAGVRKNIVGLFGEGAGGAFDGLVKIGSSIAGVAQQLIAFGQGPVKSIFENVLTFVTGTVAPAILNIVQTVAPYVSQIISGIGSAIMTVANMITTAIQAAWPVIQMVAQGVLAVASVLGPAFGAALANITTSIQNIVTSLSGVLNGLIQFITGVFTGNWQQAWEGVKQIFGNAFNALIDLCKTPINAVIGLINGAINGINSILGNGITIPDWVPEQFGGGKTFSLSLPTIPMLAAGGFTNGVSIAGEAGTEAVISFDPAYRSANIQTWQQAGQMLGVDNGAEVLDIGVSASGSASATDAGWQPAQYTYAPQIIIQGNADRAEVQQALDEGYERFKQYVSRLEREHRRRAY